MLVHPYPNQEHRNLVYSCASLTKRAGYASRKRAAEYMSSLGWESYCVVPAITCYALNAYCSELELPVLAGSMWSRLSG